MFSVARSYLVAILLSTAKDLVQVPLDICDKILRGAQDDDYLPLNSWRGVDTATRAMPRHSSC